MISKKVLLFSLIFILLVYSLSMGAFFSQNSLGINENRVRRPDSTQGSGRSPDLLSSSFEKEKIPLSPSLTKGDSGGLSEGRERDIIDIKPLEKIERDYRKILLIAAIIIILICLVLLGYFYFKNRKKKTEAQIFIPPHEIAFRELTQLKEKRFLENGEYQKFYFAFSEIFRRYLEKRFLFPATERTSEEIIPLIQKTGIFPESHFLIGRDFLLTTDLVKFAKHFPLKEETERIEEDFLKFIEGTKEEGEALNSKSQIPNSKQF
ncbi:MAG: hypothetical protein A3C43_05305 [Candidatus Schekmanbacteria bacterium RIFCSPHIGHO2_02_FULL_38_11]|uniref:Uncharacterized protein n=1 Tax=Candidatus Schekmanbacteria bacterium RIFCSPLOWO2_12_FULL_38_15 TaxID=1817883 RepID=A0A1F7SCB5_9BACT|nr:MAG: hypothetical protein A2043_03230 [Candidatus Schekmanbacteria bacterium GWA2_38_9]OGL51415.1 MAG: hypothetical protein A3G31_06060 [Candidatus Schekmanbacteria bacterium RIFCSPLOWO2_12_FULL_38_15]OGL51578.1 MAG: hypothetical protein A3H37_09505 [Candidatus Schekmanbacteria bacterium RIFCSPLOWO2_02_FULL_38_14]OGL53201.1 MAG: hypothetical protein A3C43_05305 [Candidatus Schekmanbacteria bacterium RIFCSPHIGHO2_02_FULL_38_11]